MGRSIYLEQSFITKFERQQVIGHKGLLVWLTGLSGSGKSTLACHVEKRLFQQGKFVFWVDGDSLRNGINRNLGFSAEDRNENVRRIAEVAKLFVNAGYIVIVSCISPMSESRKHARSLVEPDEFLEVYVDCPLEECERRDPKGLYKKARAGIVQNFTGITSPYEPPKIPELIINTKAEPLDECVEKIQIEILGRTKLS